MPVSDGKSQGFLASFNPSGTAIIIKGYIDSKGNRIDITKPTVSNGEGSPGVDLYYQPKQTYNGVSYTNDPAAFSFGASTIDGIGTLQENVVVHTNIDGVEVDVNELAGSSYVQVTNDVFTALTNAGLQGVSNDGQGDLVFTNNYSGQPVSQIWINLIGDGQNAQVSSGISYSAGTYPA